jgi:hypothetical protein
MTIKPKTESGDYGRASNNQGAARGAFEDRIIDRGKQPRLGNQKARDVGPGGPGRGYEVSKAGQQAQHGDGGPPAPRSRGLPDWGI